MTTKHKIFGIVLIFSLVLGFIFTNPGRAINFNETGVDESREKPIEELIPPMPEKPPMPGRLERTGTSFELEDSEYLNISLQSTEEITVLLESVPKTISLNIESSPADSTELTIGNLEPNKTYYKYQDSYKNEAVFTTDDEGNYTYAQDLSQPHHVWIQEEPSTIFLPEQCNTYGTWDEGTSTCTLNQDLTESVEITENNITLDCDGHKISGTGTGYGVYLSRKENVTIKNCTVSDFSHGVNFYSSSNNDLINNTILNNEKGIASIQDSSNNSFTNNTILENGGGIYFSYSTNSNLINNNISNNNYGVLLWASTSGINILTGNTIDSNAGSGLYFHHSSSSLTNNIVSNNGSSGIYLYDSSNSTLTGNTVKSNNGSGILLSRSSNCTLTDNVMSENLNNFGVFSYSYSSSLSHFTQNIDTSNTVNGNPIYYWVDQQDKQVPSDAGFVGLINSKNITVKDSTLTNNRQGVLLAYTEDSTIENVTVLDNYYGIYFTHSFNNKIYHNDFINNHYQAYTVVGIWPGNLFDDGYPSGGNYWSDYTGGDLYSGPNQDQPGSDGIGDTSYYCTGGRKDNYPFMEENGWEVPTVPDFTISNIKPVQVVFEPDINDDGKIDLVAGKSTMIQVEIEMKDYKTLDKQQLIEVRLVFDGVNYTKSRTIEQLEQNNRIEFYPTSPVTTGDQTIIALVDPENKIEEADEANNENSTEITVKDTNNLHLVYFPVDAHFLHPGGADPPWGYGPIDLEEYSETVSQSGKFISATYPVAEGEFINQKSDWKYYGAPVQYFSMINDIISIWIRGELVTGTLANRAIGVVPDDYFRYHLFENARGGYLFPAFTESWLKKVAGQ